MAAAAGALKNNIETYLKQFKSFSDTVRISDGKICNLGVDFTILPEPTSNFNDALLDCFIVLRSLFIVENTNFNSTIVVSDYAARLQALEKVRSVVDFSLVNKWETEETRTYSQYQFDVQANTENGVLSLPEDVVWEMKYPNFDIVGRSA